MQASVQATDIRGAMQSAALRAACEARVQRPAQRSSRQQAGGLPGHGIQALDLARAVLEVDVQEPEGAQDHHQRRERKGRHRRHHDHCAAQR